MKLSPCHQMNSWRSVMCANITWPDSITVAHCYLVTPIHTWISIIRTPIQAALKTNIFLSHRLYAVIGIFSLLGNIILLFTDFILFWTALSFIIYQVYWYHDSIGWLVSFLFVILLISVGIYFLSVIVEKKLQSFLFEKFKSRMDKTHESAHHQPIQQLDSSDLIVFV